MSGKKIEMRVEEKYKDDLWDITDIPRGTILRDWFEDGIRTLVMRGRCHLCVYYGIPENHPLAGEDYDKVNISVHGGLTFSDKGDGRWRPAGYWWYGYDYGHCDDYGFFEVSSRILDRGKKWTLGEVVKDSWGGLYDLKKMMQLAERITSKAKGLRKS